MAICIVSGRVTRASGSPLAGIPVYWRLDAAPNSQIQVSPQDELKTITDNNGNWSISLEQDTRMIVRIPELRLFRQVRIPTQAAATLEEVLNADV
jgi:hypothetical protein